MHIGVAFGWSAVFLFVLMRIPLVRAIRRSRYGVIKVAAVYGPCIWIVMSLAIVPVAPLGRRRSTTGGGFSSSATFHSSPSPSSRLR